MWCVAEQDQHYIRRMEGILVANEKAAFAAGTSGVCIDEKTVVLTATSAGL